MRFFCASIVGDVLTSSCIAYTLRCSVRRRLTTTEKSLFLESPINRLNSCIAVKTRDRVFIGITVATEQLQAFIHRLNLHFCSCVFQQCTIRPLATHFHYFEINLGLTVVAAPVIFFPFTGKVRARIGTGGQAQQFIGLNQ